MSEHADTARSAALMPGEACPAYCEECIRLAENAIEVSSEDALPCPDRYWHHVGTTCATCGLAG
jgi:hypothetical protein